MGRPPSCLCGECQKCKKREYMRSWYAAKGPEYAREMSKKHRARAREYERAKYANDDDFRRIKRARNVLCLAVSRGKVIRKACEVCGFYPAEGHHDDYSRPLDVRWLCKEHHEAHHAAEHYRNVTPSATSSSPALEART